MRGDAPYSVLVVEDDPNHSFLISLAFEQGAPEATVHLTARAEEGIAFLLKRRTTDGRPIASELPDVIVLDVSMPGLGGLGFLEWVSYQSAWLPDIPVVVFTSSDADDLARQCFALGAREFKEKPADFQELVDLVTRILRRWRPDVRGAGGSA